MKLPEPPHLNTRTEIYKGDCHIWKNGNIKFYEAQVLIETKAAKSITFQIQANGKTLVDNYFEVTLSELVTINDVNDLITVYRVYQGKQQIGTLQEGWLHFHFAFNECEVFFRGEIG